MLVRFIEFLPLMAFFVSYRLTSDMILATAIVVSSCVLASLAVFALTRTLSRMQIFLTAAVILFGVPTVLLDDPQIIKWKVTVVDFILAGATGVCQYLLRKNPFHYLFGRELPLPPAAWNTLSSLWMIYFVLAGLLNVFIAFHLPGLTGISEAEAEAWWVDYKTFGNAVLNFIFAVFCAVWLYRKYPGLISDVKPQNTKNP